MSGKHGKGNRYVGYKIPFIFLSLLLLLSWLTLSPRPIAAQQQPPTKGDVANGIVIFQQRCANCHGVIGMGDGELAANLPAPPIAIGLPDYALTALPSAMLTQIMEGDLTKGMPPFGAGTSNALTDQEGWDLISAIFSMSNSGDAMRAASQSVNSAQKDILEAVDWFNTSNEVVLKELSAVSLDTESATVLVDWGRMTYSAEYFIEKGIIAGTILDGTLNQPLTEGVVTLVTFEGFERVGLFEAPLDQAGHFEIEIENVPSEWFARASIEYDDVNYSGDFLQFTAQTPIIQSDITVFATTDLASSVRLELFNTIIDVAEDRLIVNQLYSFGNISNQVYVGGLRYGFPDSAEDISVSRVNSGQFIAIQLDEEGLDPAIVYPGSGTIATYVRYTLPYDGEVTLKHVLDYPPTRTALSIPVGVEIEQTDWVFDSSDTANGTEFNTYTGKLSDLLQLDISKFPAFTVNPTSGERMLVRDNNQELLIGAGVLAATILGAVFITRSWQQQPASDPTTLLQEIATLDDTFAAKQIKRKPYQEQRRVLMQMVKDVWKDE